DISMPEVEDFSIHEWQLSAHRLVKRFGPRNILPSLVVIHVVALHQLVEATIGSTGHCLIPSAKNVSVEKKVLIQELAARRPCKAGRTGANSSIEKMAESCRCGNT